MALSITLDGTLVDAAPGMTVLQAALAADHYIPALCAHPDLPPQHDLPPAAAIFHGTRRIEHDPAAQGGGGCGICAVDVEGEGRVPACATKVRDGMMVVSRSAPLEAFRRERLAAILAHHPHACLTCAMREGCTREPCSMSVPVRERCCSLLGRCELQAIADYVGIDPSTKRYVPAGDPRITGEPLFDRDPELCIDCGRCARACAGRDVGALGWIRDSAGRRWVGPIAGSLADSGCRFCGSCVEVCPTGALMDRDVKPADRLSALVPCRAACPAGTDVPRYVGLVADGRLEDAAAVVAERAPLVEVLGHVCFHPCETACRRNQVNGAPISICAVKREAGAASAGSWTSRLALPNQATGRKVAVVGGGPAGLVAAFTLRLLGHEVAIFEAGPELGGMLVRGIPPFRLPREVVARETRALTDAGIAVHTNTSVGHAGLQLAALRDMYDAVVVATGAALSMGLAADGEDRREVRPGLSVLADACAGRLGVGAYQDKKVVVIGGGNVAIDCARTALRLGATRVEVVCLEQLHEMPAFAHEVHAAVQEGIRFHHGWGVRGFTGNGRLRQVSLKKCVRVFDAAGRFSPAYEDAVTTTVDADEAIVAVGQRPDRSILPDSLDRIFLAGDLATGPRSVVEAIASGRDAALAADKHLGGNGTLSVALCDVPRPAVLGPADGFAARPRLECLADTAGRLALRTVSPGLGAERARLEADRCLRCDLRLAYRSPVLPPKGDARLRMEAASLERVPEVEGVLRFYAADGSILAIVGTPNGRQEVAAHVGDGNRAVAFDFEACPMYTQRQNEMLSRFVEMHGRMPPGMGGNDDVDELF